MTDIDINDLGPVDYLVVEFPPATSNSPNGGRDRQIGRRQTGSGTGLGHPAKDPEGSIKALEIDDLAGLDELRVAETQLAELLAEEDVVHLAAAMEPGTAAGVLVWKTPGRRRSLRPLAAPGPAHRQRTNLSKPSWPPWKRTNRAKENDMPLRPARAAREV